MSPWGEASDRRHCEYTCGWVTHVGECWWRMVGRWGRHTGWMTGVNDRWCVSKRFPWEPASGRGGAMREAHGVNDQGEWPLVSSCGGSARDPWGMTAPTPQSNTNEKASMGVIIKTKPRIQHHELITNSNYALSTNVSFCRPKLNNTLVIPLQINNIRGRPMFHYVGQR